MGSSIRQGRWPVAFRGLRLYTGAVSTGGKGLKRRRFLAAAAAGAAVACNKAGSPWRYFSEVEAATLDAVAECLIPADQDSGARQASVVRYIDTQLTRKYRDLQGAYRTALAGLDRQAGKPFVELSSADQTAVLARLERGRGRTRFGGGRREACLRDVACPRPAGFLWQSSSRRQPRFCQLADAGDPRRTGSRPPAL